MNSFYHPEFEQAPPNPFPVQLIVIKPSTNRGKQTRCLALIWNRSRRLWNFILSRGIAKRWGTWLRWNIENAQVIILGANHLLSALVTRASSECRTSEHSGHLLNAGHLNALVICWATVIWALWSSIRCRLSKFSCSMLSAGHVCTLITFCVPVIWVLWSPAVCRSYSRYHQNDLTVDFAKKG